MGVFRAATSPGFRRNVRAGERRHYCNASDAPLVVALALHHRAASGIPASADSENARIEHEAQHEQFATRRGTQEFSGCVGKIALS